MSSLLLLGLWLSAAGQPAWAELDIAVITDEDSPGAAVNTVLRSVQEDVDAYRMNPSQSAQAIKNHVSKGLRATYATAEYQYTEGGKARTHTILARSGADPQLPDAALVQPRAGVTIARLDYPGFESVLAPAPGSVAATDAELKIARTMEYMTKNKKLPLGGELRMWISQAPCESCSGVLDMLHTKVLNEQRVVVRYLPVNSTGDLNSPSGRFHTSRKALLHSLQGAGVLNQGNPEAIRVLSCGPG